MLGQDEASVIAASTRGASFLVLRQIASRVLTFVINQALIRFIAPETLGVSSQLDLLVGSVLYFSRENIRIVLQRQGVDSAATMTTTTTTTTTTTPGQHERIDAQAQEAVNLSYLAVLCGPVYGLLLGTLYLRSFRRPSKRSGSNAETSGKSSKPPQDPNSTPYFWLSLLLYAIATWIELLTEPCFAIAQLRLLFSLRASAETVATLARCAVSCVYAFWGHRSGRALGALPFALGQLAFAVALAAVYLFTLVGDAKGTAAVVEAHFSLLPKAVNDQDKYILSFFPRRAVSVALNLFFLSGIKHVLTQGDTLIVAFFTDLTTQGVYALAANYGSVLARVFFQPIEESSRTVFGHLLAEGVASPSISTSRANVDLAQLYLLTVLHAYTLLSLVAVVIGPFCAPILLRYIAGSRWTSTSAPRVLSAYCYYIPFLAFNGVLEAFVSAVALPAELRTQSWVLVLSTSSALAGFVLLNASNWGAVGLVAANSINMAVRIVWCLDFAAKFFPRKGVEIQLSKALPEIPTVVLCLGFIVLLAWVRQSFDGSVMDMVKVLVFGGAFGLALSVLPSGAPLSPLASTSVLISISQIVG